jgi:predicted small lipoprotein YifL
MNKRAFQLFLTSLCFLFVISCGNKGDLYMPEKDKAQDKDQEISQQKP